MPGDVLLKVKSGIEYERSIPWLRLTIYNPLFYIDFPDLKKITINGTNWPFFSETFVNKSGAENSITDLEAIRNKIAHNRFVSELDISIMNAAYVKLIGSMSMDQVKLARAAASLHVPVRDRIIAFAQALGQAADCMTAGTALDEAGHPQKLGR